MSDTEIVTERDNKSGRFLSGCKPGPGRSRGSRNRLADAFIQDLKAAWETHGASVLERVARDEPAALLRTIAMLMPRDLNLNIAVDAAGFAEKFKTAQAMLGNSEPPPQRRALPRGLPVVINND
jgi:hypothetical protein